MFNKPKEGATFTEEEEMSTDYRLLAVSLSETGQI